MVRLEGYRAKQVLTRLQNRDAALKTGRTVASGNSQRGA